MSARDFYVALLLVAAVAVLCLLLLLLHRFFLLLFGLTRIGVCACMCIRARLSVVFFCQHFYTCYYDTFGETAIIQQANFKRAPIPECVVIGGGRHHHIAYSMCFFPTIYDASFFSVSLSVLFLGS